MNIYLRNHRQDAVDILGTAQKVRKLLDDAAIAQNASQNAIDEADRNISDAEDDLTQVFLCSIFLYCTRCITLLSIISVQIKL